MVSAVFSLFFVATQAFLSPPAGGTRRSAGLVLFCLVSCSHNHDSYPNLSLLSADPHLRSFRPGVLLVNRPSTYEPHVAVC